MFPFDKDLNKQKQEFAGKIRSSRNSYLLLAVCVITLFLTVIYLGPIEGLREFGFFLEKKLDQLIRAEGVSSVEAENAMLAGPVTVGSDSEASGGKYIEFATNFQPSAPYFATFFYAWYLNPNTDGRWSYWPDQGNNPPNTWFSHYIPDPKPNDFDPANELYSSNNWENFKWQATKMAESKQEVAISSWFGQNTKQDVTLNNILNDFMARADNPYPNLRWAIYYECEGITSSQSPSCPSSTADPTVSQIVSDLNYIKSKYADSPYMLKVNGKPVIFVYGATEGTATSQKWKDANSQVGNSFYIVLKVYAGWESDPNQPDSWHQYAPSNGKGSHLPHSFFVSPGFWRDGAGDIVRLARDPSRFENDVKSMVASTATWRLTQTWNEWGEGTSIEPGLQTLIDSSGKEVLDPNGTPFGNLYVEMLNRNLPPLEAGTGR